jgi:hypothetical protein
MQLELHGLIRMKGISPFSLSGGSLSFSDPPALPKGDRVTHPLTLYNCIR